MPLSFNHLIKVGAPNPKTIVMHGGFQTGAIGTAISGHTIKGTTDLFLRWLTSPSETFFGGDSNIITFHDESNVSGEDSEFPSTTGDVIFSLQRGWYEIDIFVNLPTIDNTSSLCLMKIASGDDKILASSPNYQRSATFDGVGIPAEMMPITCSTLRPIKIEGDEHNYVAVRGFTSTDTTVNASQFMTIRQLQKV